MKFFEFEESESSVEQALQAYLVAYDGGIKKIRNAALATFIDAVNDMPVERKERFLETLCVHVYDEEVDFPLQFPLQDRLLAPYLLKNYNARKMPQVRWLVQLGRTSRLIDEALGEMENRDLLLLALDIAPDDIKSWNLLAQEHLETLNYATHHMPDVLFFGLDSCLTELSALGEIMQKDRSLQENYHSSFQHFQDLLADWASYQGEVDVGTFAQWCRRNDRTYQWVVCYKYEDS